MTRTYIAKNAEVHGDVHLEQDVSIWFHATIRAEYDYIKVGEGTNIQDGCMLHCDKDFPVIIGQKSTIGHAAIIHGCTVGSNTLIGMGAIIMDGARVGDNCIVGAGALITNGMKIPDGSVVMGSPAKVVRAIKPEEIESNRKSAEEYIILGRQYFA